MAVVRNAFLVSAALTAPTVVLTPPLGTEPNPEAQKLIERRLISQVAIGGRHYFDRECASCHGFGAKGTEIGPSLLTERTWRTHLPKEEFHRIVRHGQAQQNWSFGDMPGTDNLGFNEIEMVARYIHEIQRPDFFR